MKPYKEIFLNIENTLRKQSSFSEEKFNSRFGQFKHFENQEFSNYDYYNKLVEIVFYSGMNAATVSKKMPTIKKYFSNYREASSYDKTKIKEIMSDPGMIKNKPKIEACVKNANVFINIINEFGSIKDYIENYQPQKNFENLLLFKEAIDYRFAYLGQITSYHFMTEIGLPVLKPDRVITRIFERLGLIEDKSQYLKTVIQGRKMSQATGYPIKYVDICLVKYGQKGKDDFFGLKDGICLEKNPKCSFCNINDYCSYNK